MRPVATLALADFAPDAAPFLAPGLTVARNVVPRSDGTDGPLRAAVVYSDALPAKVLGAFSARDRFGASYVLAGTAATLQLLNGTAWTNKSGAAYATTATGWWTFTQFGERVIATNEADTPQAWVLGAGGNFAALTGAPKARYVATFEPGFVVLGRIDTGSGAIAGGLRWSALNDGTSWPTVGTLAALSVQSDDGELPGGGMITGLLPAIGGASGIILTERALYRAEYVGPPSIFAFREVDRSRGCICPNGIAQVGPIAYFISEDGFCAFDGAAVRNIGFGKVDRTFFNTVDSSQLDLVSATVDLERKCIIWAYPTAGASSLNRWLVYSYAVDRWRDGDDAALAVELLFPARTAAITLDQADAFADNIDVAGAPSLDSPLYSGGRRILAGFNTAHRLVTFDGAPLAARIETQDSDSRDGRRVFVSGIRPLTDAPTYTARVGARSALADAVAYSTPTAPQVDGFCPQRVDGRYNRAVIEIPAAVEWSFVQGAEAVVRPSGRR